MTTIAFDGLTLAADRLGHSGATGRICKKLFDCGDYLYGCVGSIAEGHLVAEWLTNGAHGGSERVDLEESGCSGVVVHKLTGKAYLAEGKKVVLTPIHEPYFASGSGHEYARAALALGKTAAQAVAFASKFDIYTGLGVDTMRVKVKK